MKEVLIFMGGVTTGVVGLFFSGFLSSVGSDCWSWVKKKIQPPIPEDRIVNKDFIPEDMSDENSRRWVLDTSVADWEAKGFKAYRDSNGRRCKRQTRHPRGQLFEEFLMIGKS